MNQCCFIINYLVFINIMNSILFLGFILILAFQLTKNHF